MKKTFILLLLFFVTSLLSKSIPTRLDSDSTTKTLLAFYNQKDDTLIQVINGITKSFENSYGKIQNAVLLEVTKSDSIFTSLKLLESSYNQWNSKLNNSIQSGFSDVTNKIPDSPSDLMNILGSIIGAVLSGAFAIWVFFQGKRNDKKKEEKMLFNYGEEVYTLLKNITINARKQVELLEQLIKSIKTNPHIPGKFQHINFNLLKLAQSLDTTKVFTTFQYLNLEKKSYIKFYQSIDFLLEEFTNIDYDYHKNNSDTITPLSNDFLKLRQEIFLQGTEYIELKRRESKTDDPFYQFINNLIIKYYESPSLPETVDIKYDFDMLIKPLKPEIIEKYRDYDQANSILNLAKQAGDLYISITQINVELANNVDGQIGYLTDMINILDQIEKELKTKYVS
jgi:hypothetical protein